MLSVVVGIVALLAATPALAQTINQCANGPTGDVDCTGNAWVTGSLNSGKSRYREGDFVPFRVTITGLHANTVYTLGIGYDAVVTGLHAYDYLGSYDASRRPGQSVVPCSGVAQTAGQHACGASPSTLDVPLDTHTTFPGGSQQHGVFSAWGARLDSASYIAPSPINVNTTGTVERTIDVNFTAQGPAAVIAWGGHVASILDWGAGRTFAGSGSGAPFHMRLKMSPSFNPGNQDLSLHAGVIAQDVSCGGRLGPLALEPGTHHVGETSAVDAELSDYKTDIGGDCGADGSIKLEAGHSATCTITNARRGTPTAVLTVVKHCAPAHDNGRFVLGIDQQEFSGIRCGESTGPITVAAGTRLVREVAATPAIADNYKAQVGGDCAISGTVTLAPAQHATCTVTNTRLHHRHPPSPPNNCYTLTASPRTLLLGQRGTVEARAAVRGRPVPDVFVRLSGAGIAHSGRTRASGVVRFAVTPRAPGRIAVATPRQFGCPPAAVSHVAVVRIGAPSFTG